MPFRLWTRACCYPCNLLKMLSTCRIQRVLGPSCSSTLEVAREEAEEEELEVDEIVEVNSRLALRI